MIVQNNNPAKPEDTFSAFVYENGTGLPILLTDPDEVESKLKGNYSDCPTKAKEAKAKKPPSKK